jgi:hypothetical protein
VNVLGPRDKVTREQSASYFRVPTSIDPGLIVAALLALFAVVPLLSHSGLPNTADGPAHLMRQAELNQAWQDGVLYPRWAPDLAYGYGMPLFNYAPPLLYHVTQLISLSGLSLDVAMKTSIILILFLYSMGMYLFARDLYGPRAGLLAAAVYLYAPYRLREAYIQGNYGQLFGLAFYPLILWSFHGLFATDRRRYVPLAALSLAGLLLSHNISAMIFAPLFGAYLVFLLALRGLETGRLLVIKVTTASIALGLGLSAFFWLPAFAERDLIRLSGITTGFFDFRYNFISLAELLALPRPLDLSAVNPNFPLSLGVAQMVFAALALLGIGLLYTERNTHYASTHVAGQAWHHTLFFAMALLITAFLTLPSSQLIWETVPLLELAEFPWRWLGPAMLCAAVLAGAAQYMFERLVAQRSTLDVRRWSVVALGVGLVFVVAVSLFYLFPSQFIPWGTPGPADAVAYETESRAIGTTSAGEFLPRWAERFPEPEALSLDYAAGRFPAKIDPTSLPDGATATTLVHTARETGIAVNSPTPFAATFRTLYWPGWRVLAPKGVGNSEDQDPDFKITWPDGLIRAQLPAGEYLVRLRLLPTPIRRTATIISISALVIFLTLSVVGLRDWRKRRRDGRISGRLEDRKSDLPYFDATVIGLAVFIGLLVTRPMAAWFHVQSPTDVVRSAQYGYQADFGHRVRLIALDLPSEPVTIRPPDLPTIQLKAGGSLPLVLYWRALAPLSANYSVFVHLDAPDGTTYAGADELNPADIPTVRWPPSLYVRNPMMLALPADLPPIRYTLMAGLYDPDSAARLQVTACDDCSVSGDALPLAHVWVSSPEAAAEPDISRRIDFRVGDRITLLGYELTRTDPATLTLYWRAEAPLEDSYTVFVHILDANGEVIDQFDSPPLDGLYPTDAWQSGQTILDPHVLTLPDSAQALAVGLYDPVSLTRLLVIDASGARMPDDAIRIQVAGDK